MKRKRNARLFWSSGSTWLAHLLSIVGLSILLLIVLFLPRSYGEDSGIPDVKISSTINSMVELNVPEARLELLLSGLNYPMAFEFINERELLIAEKARKLYLFDIESKVLTPIVGVPEISTIEGQQNGLLDVALHPGHADNHRIYFSYTIADEKTGKFQLTAVGAATLEGNDLVDVVRILEAEPFTWSPSNFGGALEFDDRGYLYVTIGDRSDHGFAQSGDQPQGKILRLNDDGSIPRDNPFVGDTEVDDRIYSLGVRNPQGLYFDPVTGRLFEAEHGPMGGDEVNIILPGANYGWPVSSYGKNYTFIGLEDIGQAGTHAEGMQQPLWYYLPSRGISPITMYRGDMFPEWDGDLIVGTLRGHHISKLDLDGNTIRSEVQMLTEIDDRIRDVKVAADGSIFILAQKGDLYRLYRSSEPGKAERNKGAMVYQLVCSQCHVTGVDNAPKMSNRNDWLEIENQALDLTYQRSINGYKLMPARGLCTICTDKHMIEAVNYMLEQVRALDFEPTKPTIRQSESGG